MQIEYKRLEDIIPYAANPRKNDDAVEYVARSINEFGFKVPIIIDKDGFIIAGHTRYKAAKYLGMNEVPVICADDLTEEQVKAFRLADNKVAEMAEWDPDLLNLELDELKLDFDMSLFGFDLSVESNTGTSIEVEIPEVPDDPESKIGDIYQLGNHRLMCGDSTKEEDVSKLMGGVKAELLLTDPPYGVDIIKNSPRLAGDKIVPSKGNIGGSVLAKTRNYSAIIGDDTIDGKPYSEIVEIARKYIKDIGGFEKFAEWGLF